VRQILANKGNEILWDVVKLHNFEVVICLYDLTVEKGLEYANSTYDLGKRGGGTKRMPRDVVVFICSLRFPLPKLYQIMYAQTSAWGETCIYL
jgi:hypothetical protein